MKHDTVDRTSSASLSELSLPDTALMKKTANIDIRFTADAELRLLQQSSKSNVTERDEQALRIECHAVMHEIVIRIMMKNTPNTALYKTCHSFIPISC